MSATPDPPMTPPRRTAVVLAGGVAKGAFEAGALDVIVARGVSICQVVGASSGALNATMIAAAVRAGREADATARLLTLWREDADWMKVFHVSWRDVLEGRGLSDSQKILELLRREIPRIATAAVSAIGLRIVVGALQGVLSSIGAEPATTFEGVVPFEGEAFDDEESRERIYTAAAASAAFPVVFQPIHVPGLGECVDGGVVNDTPVRLATESGADRVIVITPYPAVYHREGLPRGLDFAAHLVDALIHERLFRDLRETDRINGHIAALAALEADGVLTAAQRAAVQQILDVRRLEVVTIRPAEELPGNVFAGFLHRELREQYIAAGQAAATERLDQLGV